MRKTPVPEPGTVVSDAQKAVYLLEDPSGKEAEEWFRLKVWAAVTGNQTVINRIADVQQHIDRIHAAIERKTGAKYDRKSL